MSDKQESEPRREGRIWPRGSKGTLWIQWYDHDGRQDVVCLDYVSLSNSAYRLTMMDGASGKTRF